MTRTAKQRRGRSDTRMSMVKVTLLESLRLWSLASVGVLGRPDMCSLSKVSSCIPAAYASQWFDRCDRLAVLPVAIVFNLFALR